MDDLILVEDLPPEFNATVRHTVADFTIAFLQLGADAADTPAGLLGSGVLVTVEGKAAILTAHHVLDVLPRSGRLGLFLGSTNAPNTIDSQGVAFVKIGRGSTHSIGPDLGALILSPSIASAIAARKSFYNLSSHRETMLQSPPNLDDGVWFTNGFLAERTMVTLDPDGARGTKWFYNFSAIGGPDSSSSLGRYDFFEFPVSYEARGEAPESWGGMSGGGLWQVRLKRQDGMLVPLPPLLCGILFYQQATTATQCGVRAHGRRSIYHAAYDCIRGASPSQSLSRRPDG